LSTKRPISYGDTQLLTLRSIADSPEWAGLQQLRIAYENSLLSLTANIFCAFVIVLLLWPVTSHEGLIAWLGTICVLTLARLTLQQKFEKADIGPRNFSIWRTSFIASACASGLAWGCLSVFLFPQDSILHQAYLTFVLGSVCASAVSTYAPLPTAFPAFCVPTLVPYGVAVGLTGAAESNLMAALVLALMLILLRAARQTRKNVTDVLELQVRNSNLTRALHHRATHDSLVDLVNHGEFNQRLERIASSDRREGGEYSIIFVDLDLFKAVNDSGGHAAGNEVLKAVAATLKRNTRAGDTVARVGGDEFALLLEDCPHKRALIISEKIREDISEMKVEHDGLLHSVGASIGIAYGLAGMHSADAMLKAADAACYQAKEDGRNRVCINKASDLFTATNRFELAKATAVNL